MCCLGCCEQSVRLVDLVPYVNSLFKEICVECMVILIGINNFRDPLVNWRLILTYDDPSACWFCVYLLPHHLSFVLRELSWLGVFSVQPSIIRKTFFFKEIPKIFLEWSIHSFHFLINEQVPSNFCSLCDSKMNEVYSL